MSCLAWKSWPNPRPGETFRRWHAGRCAACGEEDRLVKDHCHLTGLVRGYLCHACNNSEGRQDWSGRWTGWRNGDHPAAKWRHVEVYSNAYRGTPLSPASALIYYTPDEQCDWWESLESLPSDAAWPIEAPWTPAATARRDSSMAETAIAMERMAELLMEGPAA